MQKLDILDIIPEEHPTLYKRTSTGAIQTWWIEQVCHQYRVATGQIDGKISRSNWKDAEGKNIGKKNETSAITQADAEIVAEYKKKRAQGRYCDNLEDVDKKKYTAPMLAHTWEDHPKHQPTQEEYDNSNVWVQPKLDGVRCIAQADGLWTRKGKPIVAMPHIWDSLKPLFKIKPNLVLDGELYTHDLRHHLNRISGICRKTKFTPEEEAMGASIQYHIYDKIPGDEAAYLWDEDLHGPQNLQTEVHPDAGFSERHYFLSVADIFDQYWTDSSDTGLSDITGNIHWLEAICVSSEDESNRHFMRYLENEYEGAMSRRDNVGYENKRSYHLLKRKKW